MTTGSAAPPRGCAPRVFAAAAAILALVVIEAGARSLVALRAGPRALAYGFVPDRRDRHTVVLHDDLRAGYSKYPPRATLTDFDPATGATFPVKVNARGLRGADFEDRKASGTIRVVTLGASSTFGYHSRDGDTWPVRLQEILQRACSRPYEVLNFGIPHLMSDEIAALFVAEALPLDPDVVTFYEGINDASLRRERHHLRRSLRRWAPLRSAYRVLRDHLMIVRVADEVVRPHARRYSRADAAAHAEGRAARFLANLDRIRSECDARGIRLLVATQQANALARTGRELRGWTYADEERELRGRLAAGDTIDVYGLAFLTHAELMRALRDWAAQHEVELVDVVAALDERRDVLVNWVHLRPEGNRMVAETFAPIILAPLALIRRQAWRRRDFRRSMATLRPRLSARPRPGSGVGIGLHLGARGRPRRSARVGRCSGTRWRCSSSPGAGIGADVAPCSHASAACPQAAPGSRPRRRPVRCSWPGRVWDS
jgi:lysophospholipase L1-like esterase